MFRAARDAGVSGNRREARELAPKGCPGSRAEEENGGELDPVLVVCRKRVGHIAAIDFFHGPVASPSRVASRAC